MLTHTQVMSQKGRVVRNKPKMIKPYSEYMGGVDMNHFLVARYSPCCCTRKFWRKMALNLINTSVTNAYIIHSMTKLCGTFVKESVHEKFRVALGTMMLCMNDVLPFLKFLIFQRYSLSMHQQRKMGMHEVYNGNARWRDALGSPPFTAAHAIKLLVWRRRWAATTNSISSSFLS